MKKNALPGLDQAEAEVKVMPILGDSNPNDETAQLFRLFDEGNKGYITADELFTKLKREGILEDDQRIRRVWEHLEQSSPQELDLRRIDLKMFTEFVLQSVIVKNTAIKNLVIPDFEDLCRDVREIYEQTKKNTGGKVASYIPQLARVNPEYFAVSICTIDGQRYSLGDSDKLFCLQSTSKPISYCLAIEELGEETVHKHVGREPSGRSFNELSLNKEGLPHNPLINAGAIMSCSLIKRGLPIADRFDYISNIWNALCGNREVSFNNAVYLSERQTADRNFALAYFMRENKAFPENTDIIETLEFYFQCCSIESCTHNLAIASATLANAGINPLTGQRIFQEKTVQHCMSLMLTCGMYDFSGEFAFRIGLPAKSGVSGALMVVIPNVMGISIWSPRLDELGNSVRGVEFCERLIERYAFHNYDSLTRETIKKNPRLKKYESRINNLVNLIWAASVGDLDEIKRLEAEGLDLSLADYDGRTALHLAASENRVDVVRYLIDKNVFLEPVDRWGGTPLDDARRNNHTEVVKLLETKLKLKAKA